MPIPDRPRSHTAKQGADWRVVQKMGDFLGSVITPVGLKELGEDSQ